MALDHFPDRLKKLYTTWKNGTVQGFAGTDAFAVATGEYDADADIGYLKSFALITWLFGAELQGSAVILNKDEVLLAFAPADYPGLSALSAKPNGPVPKITVISTADSSFKSAITTALSGVSSIAVLTKELPNEKGNVANIVNAAAKATGKMVNAAPAIASVLAVKDEDEERRLKRAAALSTNVMRLALIQRIEKTIDNDRRVSHVALSEHAEEAILTPSKVRLPNFKSDLCDPCYPPIIQSADSRTRDREFDLRPSAQSNNDRLAFGCIVASVGARFNFYCSNISRTLLIAPSKTQEVVYDIVLKAHDAAIRSLIPDAPLKSAYLAAKAALEKGRAAAKKDGVEVPDLVSAITKNVGFGMGIEFRDSSFLLNAKNELKVEQRMIFNVTLGVQNIKDPENGTYSVLIGDTVITREAKLGPNIFTAPSRKDFKHISYKYSAEDEADEVEEVPAKSERARARSNGHAAEDLGGPRDNLRGRRRAAVDSVQIADNEEEEQRRKKHQEILAKKMLARGKNRLNGGAILTAEDLKQEEKTLLDEVKAYDSVSDFPMLRPRAILVDMDAEAVIVPINGIPVPFHISTLKNATKSDEGQYSYLRVNFHTPQATGRTMGKPDNTPKFPGFSVKKGTSAAYIKEFTFRSSNPLNLNDCLRKIKELRKRMNEKVTHALEKQSLVAQQSLVTERARTITSLHEVAIRPPMAKGKNNVGILEAHTNGFRYRCRSGSVDIIYSNIRNAFFQEANKEILVILHFHLKNEIMIGNKKAKDVQFYVQVMEAVVKLNESKRRQFDQDELEEEQRERELRNRTNRHFLKFTKEVEERYGLEFDLPYRQLQFTGAPKANEVVLLPTVSCIVNLTEWPPFVLNLEDVEIAHFERVIFQLRTFDIVFVFKGFEDDPTASGKAAKDLWLRISSVRQEELTPLKRYLDEQNIKYYEGKASLQWNEVLKKVREDLNGFYDTGGWNFLSLDEPIEGEEDSEEDADSLEGDAEFEPDPSEQNYESTDESSDSDSDSDASEAVKELEGDSDEGEDNLDSDEEGMSWEELEQKARADDLRKVRGSDDEGDDRRRRGASRRDRRPSQSGRAGASRKGGSSRSTGASRSSEAASRKRSRRDR